LVIAVTAPTVVTVVIVPLEMTTAPVLHAVIFPSMLAVLVAIAPVSVSMVPSNVTIDPVSASMVARVACVAAPVGSADDSTM
jgi:hypothetical protein